MTVFEQATNGRGCREFVYAGTRVRAYGNVIVDADGILADGLEFPAGDRWGLLDQRCTKRPAKMKWNASRNEALLPASGLPTDHGSNLLRQAQHKATRET
jgi:hypothetical protein